MLRAGPLSDERVRRLANRRFVAFTFDLMDDGALADTDAKNFLVKKRPEFGGNMISNEPLMIVTPAGKILGETINYASTRTVLKMMRRALRKHPEFNKPGEDEKKAETLVEKAQILVDLQALDAARKVLKKAEGDQARYLLGHIARLRKKWKEMEARFRMVKDASLENDLRMERAYRLWHEEEFEDLSRHLAGFPKDSRRYTEARYYQGLALYHTGEKKKALKLWKETIRSSKQDPWIYRADWAYTNVKEGRRGAW